MLPPSSSGYTIILIGCSTCEVDECNGQVRKLRVVLMQRDCSLKIRLSLILNTPRSTCLKQRPLIENASFQVSDEKLGKNASMSDM